MPTALHPSLPTTPETLILGHADADVSLVPLDDHPVTEWGDLVGAVGPGHPIGVWGLTGTGLAVAFELGAAIVGRPIQDASAAALADEVSVAARWGGTVALVAPDQPDRLPRLAHVLLERGVSPQQLVIEVTLGSSSRGHPGLVSTSPVIAELVAAGVRVGVALTGRPDGDEAEVSGWEIAALTAALLDGATLVRGVEVQRARRVRSVVEAIRSGGVS